MKTTIHPLLQYTNQATSGTLATVESSVGIIPQVTMYNGREFTYPLGINEKRHQFFLQLKDKIASILHFENRISPFTEGPCDFNRDGYTRRTGESIAGGLVHVASCLTFSCFCADKALENAADKQEQPTPLGIKQFASRMALGIMYQFQDQISIIKPESYELLSRYFAILVYDYSLSRFRYYRPDTAYGILMHSCSHYKELCWDLGKTLSLDPSLLCRTAILQADSGFGFTVKQLFSTGVRTVDGSEYEPEAPKSNWDPENKYADRFAELKQAGFPTYRWGTKDVEKYAKLGSNMWDRTRLKMTKQGSDDQNAGEELFWQQAENLAKQYLPAHEFTELQQL